MLLSRRHLIASATLAPAVFKSAAAQSLRVVVTGGHPGDPECGCGGTIARYREQGHDVTLLYLNRGEGYCGSHALSECAAIRTAEARRAGDILQAKTIFASQVDGQAIVDRAHARAFGDLLLAERPNIVFTHWPLDKHPDHRAVAMLTLETLFTAKQRFSLYYYEVAGDTTMFTPAEYVDISPAPIETRRHDACFAHASQQPSKWYPQQVEITKARGRESGHLQAEAFLHDRESPAGFLP